MPNNVSNRRTKVGDLDINYYFGGEGEPLIIIHGGASSSEAWIENASELSKDYTVYLPDLPGFGQSKALVGDYHIPELVEFVDDFAHNVGIESFHLVGHSLGGSIAANYALRSPHKVKKLVLVSSMCLGKEIAWWVRLLSHSTFIKSIGCAIVNVLRGVKWIAENLFRQVEFVLPLSEASIVIGGSLTTLKEQTIVLLNQLSGIMVPTLVVWGARDPIVPAKQAYAAAQLIPHCQVKVFEGSGHSVYRQRIDEFSQLVTDFLG